MRVKHLRSGGWLRATCALLALLLLSACGARNANETPTLSVQAIYTAARETLQAEQATQLALIPPTSTPEPSTPLPSLPAPSPLPTFSFSSPTPGGGGGGNTGACDSSAFVNETVPDGTVFNPGKSFTKTWTLMNNGTCTWNTSYTFAFKSGDQMGGANTPLTGSVGPGSSVTLSVKLIAPSSSGNYKGVWQMQNASSQAFGVAPWVLIKVGAGPTATSGPSPTPSICPNNVCTVTVSANVPEFTITITDLSKHHLSECDPGSGYSCTFTVPLHWDGSVTISGKKYTWSPSDTCTLKNVISSSMSCDFTGTPKP